MMLKDSFMDCQHHRDLLSLTELDLKILNLQTVLGLCGELSVARSTWWSRGEAGDCLNRRFLIRISVVGDKIS